MLSLEIQYQKLFQVGVEDMIQQRYQMQKKMITTNHNYHMDKSLQCNSSQAC